MSVKLLTEHHLEFLSLKGGCTGPSTLLKMPHCWKSCVTANMHLIARKPDFVKGVNNKVVDKPIFQVHMCSLIRSFVVRSLECIPAELASCKI